jgi:hypothetical protein
VVIVLPTCRNNLWIPVKNSFFLGSRPLEMGLIGCPRMLVRYCHYLVHNNLEECSAQKKRMSIKLLLLKNYRFQRLSHAMHLLLAAIHFSVIFFHSSKHSWICLEALYVLSYTHLYGFIVVKNMATTYIFEVMADIL